MEYFWTAASFVYGCVIGSFINVCICRVPLGKSIVLPPSCCSSCGSPIPLWLNIPLVSFLMLKRRCRSCGSLFSFRYFLVEFLCGCLTAFLFMHFGGSTLNWTFLYYLVFAGLLMVIFFIDLDHRIIPAPLTDYGVLFGILGSFFLSPPGWRHLSASILGCLVGYAVFLLIRFVGSLMAGQEAMGGGDVALAAMMGSFLGWRNVLLAFFLAFLLGTVTQLPALLAGKKSARSEVPFGTFLAIGAVCALFWGDAMIRFYLSWPEILP
ncbi:MAG: prepilin peptidase [bacterium]